MIHIVNIGGINEYVKICHCVCSVAQCCLALCDLMDCSLQAPLSMGLPRQEHWSGLPFSSPGDLPNPGIEPASPAWQADSLPLSHQESQLYVVDSEK